MADTKRITGGLLSGIGTGLVNQARSDREERLLELEEQNRVKREETDFNRRKGLLTQVVTGEGGSLYGITAGGDTKPLGIKAAEKAGDSGRSAGDSRLINDAFKAHTTGTGSYGGEQVDLAGVAAYLRQSQRPDLAALYEPSESVGTIVDSAEYRKAEEQAEQWAEEQTSFFKSRKEEFPEHGGSKTDAIRAKTMEIYNELTGGKAPTRSTPAKSEQSPATARVPAGLSGGGSEADPYIATTQEHVKWFLDNAPSGAVIRVNGKLYQK